MSVETIKEISEMYGVIASELLEAMQLSLEQNPVITLDEFTEQLPSLLELKEFGIYE